MLEVFVQSSNLFHTQHSKLYKEFCVRSLHGTIPLIKGPTNKYFSGAMKTESNAADPSSAQINAFDVTFEREVYSNEERYEIEKGNCQTQLPVTEVGFVLKGMTLLLAVCSGLVINVFLFLFFIFYVLLSKDKIILFKLF